MQSTLWPELRKLSELSTEELFARYPEEGTIEWAHSTKKHLEESLDTAVGDVVHLTHYAIRFIELESWRQFQDDEGNPFKTFKSFCMHTRPQGLGCTEHSFFLIEKAQLEAIGQDDNQAQRSALEAERAINEHGTNQHTGGGDNYNVLPQRGDSADYLTARIARDHDEIYNRMLRGEYRSVRAAAIDAGIINPKLRYSLPSDPAAAAAYLLDRVDEDWIAEFVRELCT